MAVDADLRESMYNEVIKQRAIAERMSEQSNPRGALNHLRFLRDKVEGSDLVAADKNQLLSVVGRRHFQHGAVTFKPTSAKSKPKK